MQLSEMVFVPGSEMCLARTSARSCSDTPAHTQKTETNKICNVDGEQLMLAIYISKETFQKGYQLAL